MKSVKRESEDHIVQCTAYNNLYCSKAFAYIKDSRFCATDLLVTNVDHIVQILHF